MNKSDYAHSIRVNLWFPLSGRDNIGGFPIGDLSGTGG